jgi:hypothetical protein
MYIGRQEMTEFSDEYVSRPKNIDPKVAIEALVKMMKDDRSGGYAINRGEVFSYELICDYLTATIPFKDHISEGDRRRLVSQTLEDFSRFENSKCTWEALKSLAEEKQRKFARTRYTEFHIWTAWSVSPTAWPRTSVKFSTDNRESVVRFRHSAPALDHSNLQPALRALKLNQFPSGWIVIDHMVQARTISEAFQVSSLDLNFLRGLLNHLKNRNTIHRHQSPIFLPINEIRGSELTTIHDGAGQCVSNNFWYTQPFRTTMSCAPLNNHEEVSELLDDSTWVRRRIAKLPLKYAVEIKNLFVAYSASMDEADVNDVFFSLWTVMERLAGIYLQGAVKYDLLIKRIQVLFENQVQAKAALELLRYRRNDWVHRTSASSDANSLVWATHMFVAALFDFHIRLGPKFSSLSEACEYLDLTDDVGRLKRNVNLSNLKLKQLKLN